MEFILGFAIGGFVMWIGFKQNLIQWKKDLEKLKKPEEVIENNKEHAAK